MSITAGDIRELAFDHRELGNRIFDVKSSDDHSYKIGGLMSDDSDDNITTTGKRIDRLTVKPWELEVTLGLNPGDSDFLQQATGLDEGSVTVTFMSNEVRSGRGKPVGELSVNNQAGTITVKFQGGGTFNAQ